MSGHYYLQSVTSAPAPYRVLLRCPLVTNGYYCAASPTASNPGVFVRFNLNEEIRGSGYGGGKIPAQPFARFDSRMSNGAPYDWPDSGPVSGEVVGEWAIYLKAWGYPYVAAFYEQHRRRSNANFNLVSYGRVCDSCSENLTYSAAGLTNSVGPTIETSWGFDVARIMMSISDWTNGMDFNRVRIRSDLTAIYRYPTGYQTFTYVAPPVVQYTNEFESWGFDHLTNIFGTIRTSYWVQIPLLGPYTNRLLITNYAGTNDLSFYLGSRQVDPSRPAKLNWKYTP